MLDHPSQRFKFAKHTPQRNGPVLQHMNSQNISNSLSVHHETPPRYPNYNHSEMISQSMESNRVYSHNNHNNPNSLFQLAEMRDQMESMVVRHHREMAELEKENLVLQSHIRKIQDQLEQKQTESVLVHEVDRMTEMEQLIRNLQNQIKRREARQVQFMEELKAAEQQNGKLRQQNQAVIRQLKFYSEQSQPNLSKFKGAERISELQKQLANVRLELKQERERNVQLSKDLQCMFELEKP